MHSHPCARRFLKWLGIGLSLLIVATWIASLRRHLWRTELSCFAATIYNGTIFAQWSAQTDELNLLSVLIVALDRGNNYGFIGPDIVRNGSAKQWQSTCMILPLWFLVLLIAIPTTWLWHRDRPPLPGHCVRCGYNLTGNTNGVCSECGEPDGESKRGHSRHSEFTS